MKTLPLSIAARPCGLPIVRSWMSSRGLAVTLGLLPLGLTMPAIAQVSVHRLNSGADAVSNALLSAAPVSAQAPRLAQPPFLEPKRPELKPLPTETPTPAPAPPIEEQGTPTTPSVPAPAPIPATAVQVKHIEVVGSTVFSKAAIDRVVSRFIGQPATFEQLLAIRTAITDLYTQQGYSTSGAFLPPQDISSGDITIQVVEGAIEEIEVKGLQRLRPGYVRSRVGLATKPPINLRDLEKALQLLQLDPLFSSVQAELKAGTTPGRSLLTLTLKEAPAFHSALTVENRDSPSVGEIRTSLGLSHQNLLGFGDRASAEIGYSSGVDSYDLSYELPLTPQETTLTVRYANSNNRLVEEPFSDVRINSSSETLSFGVRQPIRRTPTTELGVGLTFDLRRSQSFLLGNIPFSFSEGPDNGKSKVAVLRLSQDWIHRSRSHVLAARSQFSLGLNAFGATVNDRGTDGRFFSWVGQVQWVQNLGHDIVSIARVATQLTGDSLLPLEQFSVGGVDTVRGYRQNQRVGDRGVVGSVEVRVPIVRQPQGIGNLQLTPFFEVGNVWSKTSDGPSPSTLASLGLGLRWQLDPFWAARLDWGIPLSAIDDEGKSLQDRGIHFSLRFQPF